MKKVVIGNCTLYCGDCMHILSTLERIDAIVTDPPYGLGERTGTISKNRQHKNNYGVYEDTYENLIESIIPRFKQALSLCGRAVITTGGKHAWEYPKPDVLGSFYQPASCGMCPWGRQTMQPILFYGKDPRAGKTIQHTTRVLTEASSSKEHPCAKPINATMWMVERASLSGEVVLDPFMGSGTTGVACVKMGRSFIGIELDEDYFNIACKRIQEAYDQPDMFTEYKKPVQESLI